MSMPRWLSAFSKISVYIEIEQRDYELLMYLVYISVHTETECMDAMNLCAWFNEHVEQNCDLLELRPR